MPKGGLFGQRVLQILYCDVCKKSFKGKNTRRYGDGKSRCPECKILWIRYKDRKRIPRTKITNKDAALKYKYGISLDIYNDMLEKQNNCCAICYCKVTDCPLGVDHDHFSGKVRDLLCDLCNHMIGEARENIDILYIAIDYLIKHGKGNNKSTYKELEEENKLLKEKLNGTERVHQDKT